MAADSLRGQVMSKLAHLRVDFGVGIALILVHEIILIAMSHGRFPQHPQIRGSRGKHPHGSPANVADDCGKG